MEKRHAADAAVEESERDGLSVSPGFGFLVLLHIIRWIREPAQTGSPSGTVKVPDVKRDWSENEGGVCGGVYV